jgi:hypothetical protein
MAKEVYFFFASVFCKSPPCTVVAALRLCCAAHCRASSTGRTSWLASGEDEEEDDEPTMSRLPPLPKEAGTPFGQANEGGGCHGKARDSGEVKEEEEEEDEA